jgi:hypothetical protein
MLNSIDSSVFITDRVFTDEVVNVMLEYNKTRAKDILMSAVDILLDKKYLSYEQAELVVRNI